MQLESVPAQAQESRVRVTLVKRYEQIVGKVVLPPKFLCFADAPITLAPIQA